MLDILMKLYGEIFTAGGELTKVVCEDHLFSGLLYSGVVILLQME